MYPTSIRRIIDSRDENTIRTIAIFLSLSIVFPRSITSSRMSLQVIANEMYDLENKSSTTDS
jgi:hypothetical protein